MSQANIAEGPTLACRRTRRLREGRPRPRTGKQTVGGTAEASKNPTWEAPIHTTSHGDLLPDAACFLARAEEGGPWGPSVGLGQAESVIWATIGNA